MSETEKTSLHITTNNFKKKEEQEKVPSEYLDPMGLKGDFQKLNSKTE